jgi:Ca-activated chloride channel family protein
VRATVPPVAAPLAIAVAWLVLGTVQPAARPLAQSQPPVRDERPFHSSVEVTSVTATVTDAAGHLIKDLPRDAFEVLDDNLPQAITQFTHERVPLGLGVLLDISDSMFGRRIQDARAAVNRFLFELLDASDEFFLLAFNHKPRVLTGWTRSQEEIDRALAGLRPFGGTAIYDAVIDALPLIDRRSRERAALIIISDGADTASDAKLRDMRAALLRSDAFVYAIAIDPPDRRAINARVDVDALREITAESGGRTEVVQTSADLADATARIAEELNSQYVLGYNSPHGADGQFHSIRVRATSAAYRVRARRGYVATPLARRPESDAARE